MSYKIVTANDAFEISLVTCQSRSSFLKPAQHSDEDRNPSLFNIGLVCVTPTASSNYAQTFAPLRSNMGSMTPGRRVSVPHEEDGVLFSQTCHRMSQSFLKYHVYQ